MRFARRGSLPDIPESGGDSLSLLPRFPMRLLCLAFASCVSCLGLFAQANPRPSVQPRRFAILVGINQYADPALVSLQKAQNDAEDLASALTRLGGYRSITVMSGSLAYGDVNFPSRNKIIDRITALADIVRPEDQVLFFFSGHGVNDRSGESYLLPIDAQVKDAVGTGLSLARDIAGPLEAAGGQESRLPSRRLPEDRRQGQGPRDSRRQRGQARFPPRRDHFDGEGQGELRGSQGRERPLHAEHPGRLERRGRSRPRRRRERLRARGLPAGRGERIRLLRRALPEARGLRLREREPSARVGEAGRRPRRRPLRPSRGPRSLERDGSGCGAWREGPVRPVQAARGRARRHASPRRRRKGSQGLVGHGRLQREAGPWQLSRRGPGSQLPLLSLQQGDRGGRKQGHGESRPEAQFREPLPELRSGRRGGRDAERREARQLERKRPRHR